MSIVSANTKKHPFGVPVGFGARVLMRELESGRHVSCRIVEAEDPDIESTRIPVISPVARAERGEIATVQTPADERRYEIVAVIYD